MRQLEKAVYLDLTKAINSNERVLLEIQTQEQLFKKGQGVDSISLYPSYASSTIRQKKKKGQPFDRVTLKDTGDFYNSISIKTQGQQMIITASVSYTQYLLSKYGNSVFGIQPIEFKKFLETYYVPIFKESFNKIGK